MPPSCGRRRGNCGRVSRFIQRNSNELPTGFTCMGTIDPVLPVVSVGSKALEPNHSRDIQPNPTVKYPTKVTNARTKPQSSIAVTSLSSMTDLRKRIAIASRTATATAERYRERSSALYSADSVRCCLTRRINWRPSYQRANWDKQPCKDMRDDSHRHDDSCAAPPYLLSPGSVYGVCSRIALASPYRQRWITRAT